tara:strand:+ start:905 stop:1117 length:213 start_codon:yes stop_codon:yes gene_type:complete
MGFLKPKKYRPDPELQRQLKEKREEEERLLKEQEEEMEKRKRRFEGGFTGQRSLFTRAGGRGFYTEGKET